MDRRLFMRMAGIVSAGTFFAGAKSDAGSGGGAAARERGRESLVAKDVAACLRSIVPVAEPSVDRIVIGRPETAVTGIGTAWLPDRETCRRAVRDGVNVLVVHEPTFYAHWDLDEKSENLFGASPAGKIAYRKAIEDKRAWILDNGLVIIRCHDVLDKVEGFGVPYAFGEFLGFAKADIVRSRPFYNVYRTEPRPAFAVARRIARRLAAFRQPGVAFYGDKDRVVDSVGVGTGCLSDPVEFFGLDPGLFISVDDVVRTWTQTAYARDTGRPLVVVNHGASEEAGVRKLSEHLRNAYPTHKVLHYAQGCTYDWVTG